MTDGMYILCSKFHIALSNNKNNMIKTMQENNYFVQAVQKIFCISQRRICIFNVKLSAITPAIYPQGIRLSTVKGKYNSHGVKN